MNDAACSWRTCTYRIGERARASVKRMFSSPGIPNITATPSRSRQRTSRPATGCCAATTGAYRRTPGPSPDGVHAQTPGPPRAAAQESASSDRYRGTGTGATGLGVPDAPGSPWRTGPIPLARWPADSKREKRTRRAVPAGAVAGPPLPGRVREAGDGTHRGNPVPVPDPAAGADAGAGIVYASRQLLPGLAADRALQQVANVATLPGIVTASYAMPDVHLGYGFPIGGVAATDPAAGGVVSPGGVGFDISCGVRLLAASLDRAELRPVLGALMDRLAAADPAGRGPGRHLAAGRPGPAAGGAGRRRPLRGGAAATATERDLGRCEDEGAVADADPGQVSTPGHRPRAAPGGQPRLGQPLPGGAGGRAGLRRRPRRSDSGWPTARSAS